MTLAQFSHGTVVVIDGMTCTFSRLIDGDTWQLEEERTRKVVEYKVKKLLSLYEAGELKFKLAGPESRNPFEKARDKDPRDAADYTSEQWEALKIRRSYVLGIGNLPYKGSMTDAAISEVWEELERPGGCPSARTVSRWRKEFLGSGKDISSLIPRQEMKGNYKSRIPDELRNMADDVINTVYLTRERRTEQDTLDHLTGLVNRENKLRPAALHLPRPSRRLIKRLIAKIAAFDKYVARYGRDAAIKRFRHVKGHIITEKPLERVEIDHSPADCMVIDEKTSMPLGRPYITAAIDAHSRRILGIYISFEPPSYFTVARCLRQALLPKDNLLAQYPEIVGVWDAYGVPVVVVVDNGREFHSVSLENAALSVGFSITYAPRKQSWFKPYVERVIGTMIRETTHGIPGTTFSNIFEKDEYDSEKTAIITLNTLGKVVYKWIVDVYDKRPHRGLETTPEIMWRNSIQPEDIYLPADIDRLDAILGRNETRTLTHKGIELDTLFYNSSDMEVLRRRHGDKLELEIRINDSNLGEIIVLSPDQRQTFRVPALRQDYAAGLTRYQHKKCREYARKRLQTESSDAYLEAKLQIAEIIEAECINGRKRSHKAVARYTKGDLSSVIAGDAEKTEAAEVTRPSIAYQENHAAPASSSAVSGPLPILTSALKTEDTKQQPLSPLQPHSLPRPRPVQSMSSRPTPKFAPIARQRA